MSSGGDALAMLDDRDAIPKDSVDDSDPQLRPFCNKKVGILGAGIAGLYTALILDSLGIEYEILEASDRTGGRIFTYKFPGGDKYDYYEAGAMRFPLPEKDSQGQYKNGLTNRLAKLIEYGPLNQGRNRLKDNLIPYYAQVRQGSKPGIQYFNKTREPPFGAQAMGVDDAYIRAGVEAISNDITGPFVQMLIEDIETGEKKGWETLMANDSYTLRSYILAKYIPSPHLGLPPEHLPNTVIDWCGLFGPFSSDRALAGIILTASLLSLATVGNANHGVLEWKCFEGGSETLPKSIEEYLKTKGNFIRFDSRVTAIGQNYTKIDIPTDHPDTHPPAHPHGSLVHPVIDNNVIPADTQRVEVSSVAVTINGNETRSYPHVISTIPLAVLRTIDLSNAGLDTTQSNAVNGVDCHPALKIAILFKSNWWTTKLGIVGGQSVTDLPLRHVVYPSYGVDSSTPSKVLIAAYILGEDALRLSTLGAPGTSDELKELVLQNLAELHSGLHPDVTYPYLQEQFVDMHMKDWIQDEYAMASFAVFQPGYFRDLYPSLSRPAAGKRLYFSGEAARYPRAWAFGALVSSWEAVHEYLEVTGQDEKMKRFQELWGENAEWYNRPSS